MARFFTKTKKDGNRGVQFRNIPEGKGGTFKLTSPLSANHNSPASSKAQQDNPSSSKAAVSQLRFGTRNCFTCVGLCFPISGTNRVFVAHINAWVRVEILGESKKTNVTRICSADEGQRIQREVRDRLTQSFKAGLWDIDKIDRSKVEFICPKLLHAELRLTGYYIVAGIRDFFGMPGSMGCDRRSHGFFCDPQSGAVQKLSNVDFEQGWFKVQTWTQLIGVQRIICTAIDRKPEDLEDWKIQIYRKLV